MAAISPLGVHDAPFINDAFASPIYVTGHGKKKLRTQPISNGTPCVPCMAAFTNSFVSKLRRLDETWQEQFTSLGDITAASVLCCPASARFTWRNHVLQCLFQCHPVQCVLTNITLSQDFEFCGVRHVVKPAQNPGAGVECSFYFPCSFLFFFLLLTRSDQGRGTLTKGN